MRFFTTNELIQSQTAKSLGINNIPPTAAHQALIDLIENTLDPVRELWGSPVQINSGYRSPKLNKAVRGAANSQHMRGEAADITTGTKAGNKKLFAMIVEGDIPFDQIIDEQDYTWIHISYNCSNNRRQVLHLGT